MKAQPGKHHLIKYETFVTQLTYWLQRNKITGIVDGDKLY